MAHRDCRVIAYVLEKCVLSSRQDPCLRKIHGQNQNLKITEQFLLYKSGATKQKVNNLGLILILLILVCKHVDD